MIGNVYFVADNTNEKMMRVFFSQIFYLIFCPESKRLKIHTVRKILVCQVSIVQSILGKLKFNLVPWVSHLERPWELGWLTFTVVTSYACREPFRY